MTFPISPGDTHEKHLRLRIITGFHGLLYIENQRFVFSYDSKRAYTYVRGISFVLIDSSPCPVPSLLTAPHIELSRRDYATLYILHSETLRARRSLSDVVSNHDSKGRSVLQRFIRSPCRIFSTRGKHNARGNIREE
jgi:hypothetical protein